MRNRLMPTVLGPKLQVTDLHLKATPYVVEPYPPLAQYLPS